MNNRNQPPQAPVNPHQNIPDHRISEMQERLRTLELQNTQLRTTVDFLKTGPQNGQTQAPPPSAFKPEVDQAIRETVQRIVEPMQQQYRQQIGYLADQVDQAKFQQQYAGQEKFAKFVPQVEQIRQQAIAENRYITREEALRLAYFEETGKKNVEPQAPTPPPAPVFDPYFGAMVDPATGKPVQPGEQMMDDGQQQQQAPQQYQQAQQMQWQQPQPPQMQVPQQTFQQGPGARLQQAPTNHPHGNAYGQQFQLPNQGMNPQSAPQYQQNNGRSALSLESTEADLQAFEDNFGDQPL